MYDMDIIGRVAAAPAGLQAVLAAVHGPLASPDRSARPINCLNITWP